MLRLLDMIHFLLRDRLDTPLVRKLLIFIANLRCRQSHYLIVALSTFLELGINRRMTLAKLHRL